MWRVRCCYVPTNIITEIRYNVCEGRVDIVNFKICSRLFFIKLCDFHKLLHMGTKGTDFTFTKS